MNFPLLIMIAVPFLTAPVIYPLRRTPLAAPFAAAVAAALVGFLWIAPWSPVAIQQDQTSLGAPLVVFGRSLRLTETDRWALSTLWGCAALLFLAAWPFRFERRLYPIGLAAGGLWTIGLLLRPITLGTFFMGGAALLLALTLLGEGHGMEGATQYLIAASLGFLAWVTAVWAAEQAALNPGQPLWTTLTVVLIGMALILWLGVWPAYRWVVLLFAEGAPVGAAFTVLLLNYGTWFWLLAWAQEFPWLAQLPGWSAGLQTIGILMTLSSAVLALAERGWGAIGGYLWLASSGLSWLALGTGTVEGIYLSAWTMWIGVIALAGLAFGLAAHRRMSGSTESGRVPLDRGPWVIALLLGSGMALMNVPPFAGFTARWAFTRLLLPSHPVLALALIGSVGLLGWALLRELLAPVSEATPLRPMPRSAVWFGIAWWIAELSLLFAGPWLGLRLETLARAWIRVM
ncbi:hypothetical protein [Thermoflexus sp.]|uniref:hypothetical protein n=1 Tax=Thermoflexus sp. TaxID=1969742 RepID=UPI002ADDAC1C|nr:hypothetical protein [Thermoflexus sp.]